MITIGEPGEAANALFAVWRYGFEGEYCSCSAWQDEDLGGVIQGCRAVEDGEYEEACGFIAR